MKTTQPWRELRWISCRILHQWCEEKMQKWGNNNSLYLQCILKSCGLVVAVAMVISSIVTITCSSIWAQPNWCGDSVVQVICNIPTFQACKSSFYRNQAKTTPKLRTSQKEINLDQLEKDSSSVTALMPRGTEMTESWYFQQTQTFNVCSGDNA